MDEITTLGIDLAKRVFALHGVNARGRVVLGAHELLPANRSAQPAADA
ncbi:MAG: hypothetical protein ACREBC_13710 [Pyrinomonadaceae bacterium]